MSVPQIFEKLPTHFALCYVYRTCAESSKLIFVIVNIFLMEKFLIKSISKKLIYVSDSTVHLMNLLEQVPYSSFQTYWQFGAIIASHYKNISILILVTFYTTSYSSDV